MEEVEEEVEEVEVEVVEVEEVEVEAEYLHHQEVEVEAAEVLQEDHHHTPMENSKEIHLSNSQEIGREAKHSCWSSKSIKEWTLMPMSWPIPIDEPWRSYPTLGDHWSMIGYKNKPNGW